MRIELALIALLLLIVLSAGLDWRDAIEERAAYCQMVANGAWPDYRRIFAEECE